MRVIGVYFLNTNVVLQWRFYNRNGVRLYSEINLNPSYLVNKLYLYVTQILGMEVVKPCQENRDP